MPNQWNPNAPDSIGLEWAPVAAGATLLESNGRAVVQRIRPRDGGPVDTVSPYIADVLEPGVLVAEVYPKGFETLRSSLRSDYVAPNEQDADTFNLRTDTGATTNTYTAVDEAELGPLDVNTYIRQNVTGVGRATYRYATRSLSLTGRRILTVRLHVDVRYTALTSQPGSITDVHVNNVRPVGFRQLYGLRPANVTHLVFEWPVTSDTTPWAPGTVQLLDDSPDVVAFEFFNLLVYRMALEVVSCDEWRWAFGSTRIDGPGWASVPVFTPTGEFWTKGTGVDLSFVFRRGYMLGLTNELASPGAFSIPYLDRPGRPPPFIAPDSSGGVAVVNGDGSLDSVALDSRAYALGVSVSDAEPYTSIIEAPVRGLLIAEQEVTGRAGTYQLVRFLAKPAAGETAPLTVRVVRRSDGAQLGGDALVAVDDVTQLDDLGDGWREVLAVLVAPATLAASTQYAIRFICTASGSGWSVAALRVDGGDWYATGFDSTTNRGTVSSAEDDAVDLPALLVARPNTPTGLTATVV